MSRAELLEAELAKRKRAEALQVELFSRKDEKLREELKTPEYDFLRGGKSWDETMASLEPPAPETFLGQLKAKSPQIAGGIAGGIAGAKVGAPGGPWGMFGGAVGGAALGGGGGEALKQIYQQIVNSRNRPATGGEAAKRIGVAGLQEGRDEAIGRGVIAGGGKMLRPFRRTLQPGRARLSQELAEAAQRMTPDELADLAPHTRDIFAKHGVHLTGGQVTANRPLDFVENAVESTFFGGEPLYQLKKILQPKVYKKMVQEMSESFWQQTGKLSPTEVGELFLDTINKGTKARDTVIKALYSQVDEVIQSNVVDDIRRVTKSSTILDELGSPITTSKLAKVGTKIKGVSVQTAPVKRLAKQIFDEASVSKGLGASARIKALAQRVLNVGDNLSFRQASQLQSDILKEVRKAEGFLGGKDAVLTRAGKRLSSAVDSVMGFTARKHSDEAYTVWRNARKAVANKYAVMGNKTVKAAVRMAEESPERVAGYFFKPNATKKLNRMIAAIGGTDTKAFQAMRSSWLEAAMSKTTLARDATLVGQNFGAEVLGMGDDVLKTIFPDTKHLDYILDIAKTGEIIQTPIGGGGGMVAQLTQSGAIIDVFMNLSTGQAAKKGAWTIILAPAVLGKIMASKSGAKWLSEGVKAPGGKVLSHIPAQTARLIRTQWQIQRNRQKMEQFRQQQQVAPVRGQMKSPNAAATGFTATK